jgi:hypothetical protein
MKGLIQDVKVLVEAVLVVLMEAVRVFVGAGRILNERAFSGRESARRGWLVRTLKRKKINYPYI